MTGITQRRFDEDLGRFARGEMSPPEARELAQSSLESRAWFDQLTDIALAKVALESVSIPGDSVRRAWWRAPFVLATASVVVLALVASIYLGRTSRKKTEGALRVNSRPAVSTAFAKPTLVFAPGSSQPVLLAEDLQPPVATKPARVFRGQEEPVRKPRQTGSILSVDDGFATINLGSLDGIGKGTEVEVYRDPKLNERAGRLHIDTVFREQARCDIGRAGFKARYAVRLSDATHLEALLQQARDFEARGQISAARLAAKETVSWAKTANASLPQKEGATEFLAKLDFQSGDLETAETHYRAAIDMLSNNPRTSTKDVSRVQNDLASIAMLRGDYESAQRLLAQGGERPPEKKLEAYRLNNLGALAEARGDRHLADSFYTKALDILPANLSGQRKIVEANLARVKGSQ